MLMLTGLALFGSGLAQAACPERVDAAGFKARVEAVREPVAFAEDSALNLIRRVEALVPECLDGPLETEDLAALWLARGAYEVLRPGGDPASAETYLTWAYVVGSSWAYDDIYGPQVLDIFEAVAAQLLPKGTLDFSFPPDAKPTLVYLNGDLLDRTGPLTMPAGMHLVQWKLGEQWVAQLVPLKENSRITVGGGPPTEGTGEQKRSTAYVAYDKKKDRKSGFSLAGFVGYGGTRNWVTDGTTGYVGVTLAPALRFEAKALAVDFLRIRLVGCWTPGLIAGQAPVMSRFAVLVGVHLGTSSGVDVQIGGTVAPMPLVASGDGTSPEFASTLGLGPQIRIDGFLGPAAVTLAGNWYLDSFGIDLGINGELRPLERGGVIPLLGASAVWLNTPGLVDDRDNYLALVVEVGGRWSR
jgi:hypothetical protein